MVAGHAGVDQPQVAVGAAAEHGDRRGAFIGALHAAVRSRLGAGDEEPGPPPEGPVRPWQVAGGTPDLPALDRGSPYHAGPDPEGARGQVRQALEAHPHRADEGVALLLGVLTSQRGELDPEVVRVDLQAVMV